MAKRLVLCCDGTWNTPDQRKDGAPIPTNVTKFALAVAPAGADGRVQRTFYHRGVGTTRWQHFTGGAFGVGLSQGVKDAYRFLVDNYEPGDELFFLGFSRGAFTARSTAGLVRNSGILRRENADRVGDAYSLYRSRSNAKSPDAVESQLFRKSFSHETRIRFIGVWDTVGALGIPLGGLGWINKRWQFHDTTLSSRVDAARQALAIDEQRGPFKPTIWRTSDTAEQDVKQVWFSGVHCDVGGGYPSTGLSDITLRWMVSQAAGCGLRFNDAEPAVTPDPLAKAGHSRKSFYKLIPAFKRTLGETDPLHEAAASSATSREDQLAEYQPANLTAYRQSPGVRIEEL
jgi:uncharacterized protein (DUF2235 family)